MTGADLAEALEKARRRPDVAAPQRFGHDRRHVATGQPGLDRVEVVPRQDLGVFDRGRVLTGRRRAQPLVTAGRHIRAARQADEDAVEPAVIVPLELDDRVAAGRAAGDPERQLDRLAAGVGEADHLRARHDLGHEARGLVLLDGLAAELDAAAELARDGLDDHRRVVAEDDRPGSQVVVDEPVAVDVEQQRALGVVDHERR